MMKHSKHSEDRMRQRGFTTFSIDMIMRYGRIENAPGGVTKVYFGNKEYQKAVGEFKNVIQKLEKAKGGSLIVDGNRIITVYK